MKNLLTIGISTIEKNYHDALEVALRLIEETPDTVCFLLINQNRKRESVEILSPRLKVIHTVSTGLSVSRNIAISNCSTKWLWIQDDDIEIDCLNIEHYLLPLLNEPNVHLILAQVGSKEKKNSLYKDYSYQKKHSRLNAVKISSIEIIIDVSFIKFNTLEFDERLGLGTSLPCCEENLFVYKVFKSTNNIKYLKAPICYHTTVIENRNIDMQKNLVAKGFFLAHLPFYYSIPILSLWTFKFSRDVPLVKALKSLCKGFFQGKFR